MKFNVSSHFYQSTLRQTKIKPANLWRASLRETVTTHTLSKDINVELAVIGGGFLGCSAALEAARRGAKVCLLEAQAVGYGASGRNVGLVNAGLWLPPYTVLQQLGESAGMRLLDALHQGPSEVFNLIHREAIHCEATRNGTLHLAHSPSGLKALQERLHQGQQLGLPLTLLNAEETRQRTGSTLFHGALFDPRAGTIQPLSYCRGLARAAVTAGALIFEHAPVTAIHREGESWVLNAQGVQIRSKALLLATNAYFDYIQETPINYPIRPSFATVNYSQFATAPIPETCRDKILSGGEGCWDTALVMSSFRMDQEYRFIFGGIGNNEGPAGIVHHAWARRKLAHLFPELQKIKLEYAWSGKIAMTQDHVPKVITLGPSALAIFGFSGRGISPCTVFGTKVAEALLENRWEVLPLLPQARYSEHFTQIKSIYYETGAALAHAISPLPFQRSAEVCSTTKLV